MIRAVLALALIVAACIVSTNFALHHHAEDVFEALHMHVVPAGLHAGDHEPLSLAVPGFLHWATLDQNLDFENPSGRVPIFNLQLFQLVAILLIFVVFSGVVACIRSGRGDYLSRLFAGFALWIRDEMVVPVMGKGHGNRFLPFFLTLFFFIFFMNVVGLLPGAATPTANIGVTAAMATVTLCTMLGCGMVVQGPLTFWKNLIPHGVPLAFVPLLAVVEVVGLVVKPVALTIRLFANMLGGHLIVLSVMGLIGFAGTVSSLMGWVAAPLAVGFAVFIMIIESFVAMLQAYIFTYLSILFVQMCIHPEH